MSEGEGAKGAGGEKPTVFISYSHKDEEWKDRLVTHLGVLQQQGYLDIWDDTRIGAGDDWKDEIEEAMSKASVAILLVSANFLTSNFILSEEVPPLLQRREKEGISIFPIIVKPCAWTQVKWLSKMQCRPKDAEPISGGNEHQIDTDLAAITEEVASVFSKVAREASPKRLSPLEPEKISLAKLPSTGPDLFGREMELALLDAAWANQKTNVVSLVAWGGVGKSALVNVWLNRMFQDNYRGAERVYGWSFYSQGAGEGRQVSADLFIASSLEWFGDTDPTKGSAWQKAERLAELIKQQRTLLILDGLEPLQTPSGEYTGCIKDPGLCCLLKELARHNPGLCVITTRLKVTDIDSSVGTSIERVDLEHLPLEAGAKLLKNLGVKGGTHEELIQASHEFDGHALALNLLGGYLVKAFDGDIRKRDKISKLTKEPEKGGHARRVMESYEKWFEGKPEFDVLHIMGLFDRPAEGGAISALREKPVIKGLTKNLKKLSEDDWKFALHSLREARLLAKEDPARPDALDCHPLVREHFGDKLQKENPEAWKEAHGRLYEYYKSIAKELPDTIEEMAPLFAAVAHGCQAGMHQEAYKDVYWKRIQRGNRYFNVRKLGAIGTDLAALSGFFNPPWSRPVDNLTEDDKSIILNLTGFHLRALGRLAEAAQPLKEGVEIRLAQEKWVNVARIASNLSELYLAIGDVAQAVEYGEKCVKLADKGGDTFIRLYNRTTLADAFHQAGRLPEAEPLFHEAEEMQEEMQPEYPLLCSLQGFRYCDLLLGQGKWREVLERAEQTLVWVKEGRLGLITIAMEHLTLSRTHLFQALVEGKNDFSQAMEHLDRAVEGFREAGQQQYLPLGLLARAELHRVQGDFTKAQHDLDEACTIAERGGMGLHKADCHLEYARLHLAMGEKEKAQERLDTAREMIDKMGYHRRDKDLAEIEKQLR